MSMLFLNCEKTDDPLKQNNKNTWLIQLQGANIQDVASSGYSLAVIDYSKDGSDINKYSKEEINILIDSSVTPLAYISIGEAENYRFYWDNEWVEEANSNKFTSNAAQWLGHSNPDWVGNYKVRYWHSDWRDNFLKPYLDKIILQGFKGLYLDIIDAFEYWWNPDNYSGFNKEQQIDGDPINDKADAAAKMIELVSWIAAYCRENSPYKENFLIFPQNGETIFDYDSDNKFFESISGVGAESVWYYETSLKEQNEIEFRLNYLRNYVKHNKIVLVVDYLDDGSGYSGSNKQRIDDFVSKCNHEGFKYHIARENRKLDFINMIETIQP